MNVYKSCKVVFSIEEKTEKDISTIWKLVLISVKNYYIEGSPESLYIVTEGYL